MKISVTSALLLLGTSGMAIAQQQGGVDTWWTSISELTRRLETVENPILPAEAYARFGLVGTWSNDCREPASGRNWYVTYRPIEGGNVVSETEFGNGTQARMVVRRALIDSEGRLHASGFSTFEELPLPYQMRFGKDGTRPSARIDIVLAKAPDGSVRFMEATTTAEGAPPQKTVTGGLSVNAQTGLAGPPPPPRFACSNPAPDALGTRIGIGQR
ncbi:hypothetical protein FV217_15405 [Methylobacterium sp. WL9]|nr:hypothetical protein FV217_15405 [Methylobacterium sp. WL9]